MSDFEDYGSDTPDDGCEVCGDQLCPGCGPNVQTRLLRLALIPVGIVVLAVVFRAMFLGGDGVQRDPVAVPIPEASVKDRGEGPDQTSTSATSTTATSVVATALPISGGTLTEDTIKAVVQVVQVDALGPCSWGSGTVVGDDSTVLTNFHVVETSRDCPRPRLEIWTVSALDERPTPTHSAVVVIADELADLAILRLTPLSGSARALRPVPMRTTAKVGEEIFIIGFPNIGGSSITISKGIVSGFTKERGVSWIKTDASVSGGNSGGAAVNGNGELVGVPTMASAGEDGEIVDCRPVTDTNRDGTIDKYDDCVPIGGFLNLLSPAIRAESLLQQSKASSNSARGWQNPENEGSSAAGSNDREDESSDPRFPTCKEALKNGYGPYYRGVDPEYNWYRDADGDGVVCERR